MDGLTPLRNLIFGVFGSNGAYVLVQRRSTQALCTACELGWLLNTASRVG